MPALPLRHGQGLGEEGRVKLVIDTNIVLDLFVFRDAAADSLNAAIANRQVQWLATQAMRDELTAVLAYEQIASRAAAANLSASHVMQAFDEHAHLVAAPVTAKVTCRDPDDQKFVDLAVAHGATLLSKDKALLALKRKLTVMRSFAQ
jgi:putative PIN family toxin of toxin-antitoxin system